MKFKKWGLKDFSVFFFTATIFINYFLGEISYAIFFVLLAILIFLMGKGD